MTPKPSHHRSRKRRANVRPSQKIETIAAADEDDIVESLIETFPASDPPAWVTLAVSAFPTDGRNPAPL
jgi:hypothetical protein